MENYLDEQGLATYDTLIKSYISGVMTSRSEIPQSQMAVINDIDSHVDTMYANYVTKTDLQNALANIGGSEAVTIYISNASGNAHVDVTSGTTTIKANVSNGETLNIPFGTEYTVTAYNTSGAVTDVITRIASKMTSDVFAECYYQFVDLGLPSGTLWATINVGANSVYDAGYYFFWGDVTGHNLNNQDDPIYSFNSTAYSSAPSYGLTSSFTSGDPTYDAARANWGGNWRVPTRGEFLELLDTCTWAWSSPDYTVTGPNGKKITLRANGYYIGTNLLSNGNVGRFWTSLYYNSYYAYILLFTNSSKLVASLDRYYGYNVRAVRSPQS